MFTNVTDINNLTTVTLVIQLKHLSVDLTGTLGGLQADKKMTKMT